GLLVTDLELPTSLLLHRRLEAVRLEDGDLALFQPEDRDLLHTVERVQVAGAVRVEADRRSLELSRSAVRVLVLCARPRQWEADVWDLVLLRNLRDAAVVRRGDAADEREDLVFC